MLQLVNEPELDLSVSDLPRSRAATLSRSQSSKILKLQVRIKGILQNILNACSDSEFPLPLAKFLTHLTGDGAFVPHGFLTSFEMSRLNIDSYGSLQQQNQEKEQMIVAFFLLTKVLVA